MEKFFSLLSQSVISIQDYVTKELSSYRLVNGSVLSMMKSRKPMHKVNNFVKTMDLTAYLRLSLQRIASLQTSWNFVSRLKGLCFCKKYFFRIYNVVQGLVVWLHSMIWPLLKTHLNMRMGYQIPLAMVQGWDVSFIIIMYQVDSRYYRKILFSTDFLSLQ